MPKTAMVAGASGGIGGAVAKRLAKDGFAVATNYAGNASKAQAVVAEIGAAGGRAISIRADVSDPREVGQLFDRAISELGSVDVVVHCAGVMSLSPIAECGVATFDHVIKSNLRSTFLVLGEAAQRLSAGGRIIAFSSSVLAKSFPGYGAYIASKAGVEGLVRVLANELRGRQITVNAVSPGPVDTELFTKDKTKDQLEQIAKVAPMERLGEPDDIARVVSFLAGPDGAWINAQVLRANGGFA